MLRAENIAVVAFVVGFGCPTINGLARPLNIELPTRGEVDNALDGAERLLDDVHAGQDRSALQIPLPTEEHIDGALDGAEKALDDLHISQDQLDGALDVVKSAARSANVASDGTLDSIEKAIRDVNPEEFRNFLQNVATNLRDRNETESREGENPAGVTSGAAGDMDIRLGVGWLLGALAFLVAL